MYSIPNTAIPILHSPQALKTGARPQTLCKGDGTRVTNGAPKKTEIKMKPRNVSQPRSDMPNIDIGSYL